MRLKQLVGFDPPEDGSFVGYCVEPPVDGADKAATNRLLGNLCPPCILRSSDYGRELWVQLGGDAEVLFELMAAHSVDEKTFVLKFSMSGLEPFSEKAKDAFAALNPITEENQDVPA